VKVVVEWLDGKTREYVKVSSAVSKDGVLKMFTAPYYGKVEPLAEVPLTNVREWKQVEQ
jgi:hypothetical protein